MARFDPLQPFESHQGDPGRATLAHLRELWNYDKHRTVVTTVVSVGLEAMLSRWPFPDVPQPDDWEHGFEIVFQGPTGPVMELTELGRVREAGKVFTSIPEVSMDPRFAIEVAMDQGSPGSGQPVLGLLEGIRDEVRRVIGQFEAEFPNHL